MKRIRKPKLTDFARTLRSKQTDAERKIWNFLRSSKMNGVKFRRQHPIGDYIVDFVCLENKIIIEIDGGQHNDTGVKIADEQRTKWLENEGFRLIRFWNNDVLQNTNGVYSVIQEAVKQR